VTAGARRGEQKTGYWLLGLPGPSYWTWSQITACTRIVILYPLDTRETMYIAKGKLFLIVNYRNALTNL